MLELSRTWHFNTKYVRAKEDPKNTRERERERELAFVRLLLANLPMMGHLNGYFLTLNIYMDIVDGVHYDSNKWR